MKAKYYKLVDLVTDRMVDDAGFTIDQIKEQGMTDKRGLLRGTIEDTKFCVKTLDGFEYVVMASFVCSRTGITLTLDYIKGFELSQNSPAVKLMMDARKIVQEDRAARMIKNPQEFTASEAMDELSFVELREIIASSGLVVKSSGNVRERFKLADKMIKKNWYRSIRSILVARGYTEK